MFSSIIKYETDDRRKSLVNGQWYAHQPVTNSDRL